MHAYDTGLCPRPSLEGRLGNEVASGRIDAMPSTHRPEQGNTVRLRCRTPGLGTETFTQGTYPHTVRPVYMHPSVILWAARGTKDTGRYWLMHGNGIKLNEAEEHTGARLG